MNQEMKKYLSELERLANEASEGPWWFRNGSVTNNEFPFYPTILKYLSDKDGAFVVAAREAIPRLVKMVRDLDKETYFLADKAGDYGRCPKETSCINDVCTPEHRTYCWQMAAKTWRETDD